tara:strand:+ start:16475 stop:17440 length:966 start_codon:yes stop_codon:yes gene_type:complete
MNEEIPVFGDGDGQLIELIYSLPLPMRLDRWLVKQREEQSRSHIQKFIVSGLVKVNGQIAKAKRPLRKGDIIQLWLPPPEPLPYLKPEKIAINILFEDKYIIVINKTSGMAVHPAPGNRTGTLVNALLSHCNDLPGISGELRPGIVHRLDKETSGCIVVAKTQEALTKLQKQIQQRIASRNYLAIVHGKPNEEEGTIIAPIGRHPIDRKRYAVVDHESSKYACTHWKLLNSFGNYSLLSFKLDTGRTHQIRVHCSYMKHPILGDPTYSRCKKLPIKLSGQVLHANKLGLVHPISGEAMIFEAPLPLEFERLLSVLKSKESS